MDRSHEENWDQYSEPYSVSLESSVNEFEFNIDDDDEFNNDEDISDVEIMGGVFDEIDVNTMQNGLRVGGLSTRTRSSSQKYILNKIEYDENSLNSSSDVNSQLPITSSEPSTSSEPTTSTEPSENSETNEVSDLNRPTKRKLTQQEKGRIY